MKLTFVGMRNEDNFSGPEEVLGLTTLLSKPFLGEMLYLYLVVSEPEVSGALVREDGSVQTLVY